MRRVLGPEDGCKQVTVGGATYTRHADGTFHLPDAAARQARKSGDFTVAATSLASTGGGWWCDNCGFHAVTRDRCGRCGCTSLTRGE